MDNFSCDNCGADLNVWADTKRGCCARCETPSVKVEIQRVALLKQQEEEAQKRLSLMTPEQIELQAEHEAWLKSPAFGGNQFVAKRWLREKIAPADYGPFRMWINGEDGPEELIFNQEEWDQIIPLLQKGDEVWKYTYERWRSGVAGLTVVRDGEIIRGYQTMRFTLTEPEDEDDIEKSDAGL